MNGKVLTLLLVSIGLLLGALITRNGGLASIALPFLVYLGIGILQSSAADKIQLVAKRTVEKHSAGVIPTVDVSITLQNQGTLISNLTITDPLQPGMKIKAGQLRHSASLPAGGETRLQYTFTAERGSFAWKTVRIVASDPFGLIRTELNLPAPGQAEVQPEVKKFRLLTLRPQRTLHSAGAIPARLGGSGTDFWGIREYHPGDPLRRLDWRLTARHPGQFFTKEFEQEEIADIGLILDARQQTDLQVGEESLFEHSIRATASLAEVFLRQGNRVSLLVYGKQISSLFPGYGKRQLNRILRNLAKAAADSEGSLGSLEYLPVQMFPSHSVIVVISPLAPHDWQLFPRLRAFGYQVLLVSPDPVDFVQRGLPADPVNRLAIRLSGLERQLEIRRITQLWVPVINWQVSQPLYPQVHHALSRAFVQQKR